jgi:hypothetical protein
VNPIYAVQLNADIWNVLHDGTLLEISGDVPGDLRLSIEIDYLRERFPEPGRRIVLTLLRCTAFSYQPDEIDGPLIDFPAISGEKPQILRAEDWTDPNQVYCVSGTIRVEAAEFSIALDSGRPVSLEELCAASEAYWAEWRAKAPDSKP